MKLMKKVVALGASAMIMASVGAMSASANMIYESGLARFEWGNNYAKLTNISSTSRYMETHINVYDGKTGDYVTSVSDSAVGSYGVYSYTSTGYSTSSYIFEMWGEIYNSASPMSGVSWSSGLRNP